jgi:transcriptional regulator with GAF, ATPase, and Fis domain
LAEDHAHIQFDGERFSISVLQRKYNLVLNGRSKRYSPLKHGDLFVMGDTQFMFRMITENSVNSQNQDLAPIEAYNRLYLFSRELLQGRSIPELLENLVDQVIELTGAERGFLILLEGNQPQVAIGRNLQGENLANAIDLFSDSIVSQVVQEQKPLIISNALQDEQFKTSVSVIELQLSSVMCVPLRERNKLLGVLYVGNSRIKSLFNRASLELLIIFSAQASILLQNALLVNELVIDNQRLNTKIEELQYSGIIGSCDGIISILNKVRKVASTDVSVLITGETGTGKELIACELHRRSNRNSGPFITINCGAIPENLLESELFGHVKGAFTGAIANKIGKFQLANKGTLFLDELGDMPLNLQVKLLRSLEDKKITPVGDHRVVDVDIRIIAATNRNLEKEVSEGRFREDLFYRLNVICLHLPPLRERNDDISLLARYFLQKFVNEYQRPVKGFTTQAIISIRKYPWPGNVRELENRLRKAVILCEGTLIDVGDLDLPSEKLEPILPLAEAKDRFQAEYIKEVLSRNNGNRTKTARDLGVDPRTIFRHLEKEQDKKDEEDDFDILSSE